MCTFDLPPVTCFTFASTSNPTDALTPIHITPVHNGREKRHILNLLAVAVLTPCTDNQCTAAGAETGRGRIPNNTQTQSVFQRGRQYPGELQHTTAASGAVTTVVLDKQYLYNPLTVASNTCTRRAQFITSACIVTDDVTILILMLFHVIPLPSLKMHWKLISIAALKNKQML